MKGLFARYFPPPNFLQMSAVGLSVTDDAVTAMELFPPREGGECRVGRFGRRALPMGALSGGAIVDAPAVVAELAALRQELHLDFVRGSISEEKAYLYQARLPAVALTQIHAALELSLEENVPLAPVDAVFDFILGQGEDVEREVMVGVLPRAIAEGYAALFAQAGLVPLSLSLETEAIARALCLPQTDETILVVVLNTTKTTLCVVKQGTPRFTRTVLIGCVPDPRADEVFLACSNAASVLKDEIQKLSTYWQTHGSRNHASFSRIVLAGSVVGFAGFDDYLSRAFEMPVLAGNVWQNVCTLDDYLPPIPLSDSFAYAAAIGLALA